MPPAEIELNEGDTAILRVTADREIALHVHGYDLERDLEPGEAAEIRFEATLTGRFEIEDDRSRAGHKVPRRIFSYGSETAPS